MKKRIKRVVSALSILLILLGAYTLFFLYTGKGIPCIFKLVTGWSCPGCGVTRMLIAILRLDFYNAFLYNQALFVLLPFFIALICRIIYVYIKKGTADPGKVFNCITYVVIGILLVFGILRNLI
jgi:hypothetical protein